MFKLDGRPGGGLKDDAAAERLEAEERAGAEETIAADALAADHALEQKRPIALLNLAKSADGGERVADEPPVDGHQTRLARQLDKFIESRTVTHGSLA